MRVESEKCEEEVSGVSVCTVRCLRDYGENCE
jgi:hypothetical protein